MIRATKIVIIYQHVNVISDFTAIENIRIASLAIGNSRELSKPKAQNLLKIPIITK